MRDATAASPGAPNGTEPAHGSAHGSALYVVLTTSMADSGLVVGGIGSVAGAEAVRLRHGAGAKGAFVAAYVRVADALMPVHVETAALPAGTGVARYRIRAWLGQQLLGQRELEIPFDPRAQSTIPTAW